MLGLSNTLTTSSTPSSSGPIELASYTSDFSAGTDGWQDGEASTTVTGNNDGVADQTSSSKDDVFKVEFTQTLTSSYQFWRDDVFATGGIASGDTVTVSFDYLFQDPDSNTSGTKFRLQLGGYHSSRVEDITIPAGTEDLWINRTVEFSAPEATSLNRFYFRWANSSNYPQENNIFYLKNFVITHNGLAR